MIKLDGKHLDQSAVDKLIKNLLSKNKGEQLNVYNKRVSKRKRCV